MKSTVTYKKKEEIDAKYIRAILPVYYEEEDIPNDFPFRVGDTWDITIDIDKKQICDWPEGRTASLHMKVCDGGEYILMDADSYKLASLECYVPSCFPGVHYGDYIIFEIEGTGLITNWQKPIKLEQFFSEAD